MNRVCWLIALVLCSSLNAKVKDSIQIEGILNKSLQEFVEVRLVESLKSAKIALELSKSNKYSRGVTVANLYIAKVLLEIGIYNESLVYIENAEKEPFFNTYVNVRVESHRLRGRVYAYLNMNDLSIKEFYKQLSLSNEIEDENKKKMSCFWAHENLAHVFFTLKLHDSVWNHLKMQENILKGMNEKNIYSSLSNTYAKISSEYTYNGNYSKAQQYLDKSMSLLKKYNGTYLYYTLQKYGDLEKAKGDNQKAINYYQSAISNAIAIGDKDATARGYEILANCYMDDNPPNLEKANKYFYEHNRLKDSLEIVNKKTIETVFEHILNSNEKEVKSKKDINIIYLIAGVGIVGLIIILILKGIKAGYIQKNSFSLLHRNPKDNLKEPSEEDIKELFAMIKSNSPEFLTFFEKLYPQFLSEWKKINPDARNSELTFCAMAFLNLSTKDIAVYTFVTIRAVQIRKNRLRKKYNIPSEQDFNSWMRKIGGVN
ncbi:TPA: tetratricopeptide repeat protein [Elizabethkingia anophelis]|nr:tetratricopeptide repeat protein [Elizabethkingia anophelis]